MEFSRFIFQNIGKRKKEEYTVTLKKKRKRI